MSAHNDARSDAILQIQGEATGKWIIGMVGLAHPRDVVLVYAFDEQNALLFFNEHDLYYRIMYSPSGIEVKIATPAPQQPSGSSSSATECPEFTAIRMKLGPWAAQAASTVVHTDKTGSINDSPNAGLITGIAGGIVGGLGAAPAAVAVVQGIGFTTAGIAAGSTAAGMMAAEAAAAGGAIASGGLVATLQAVGATSSLAAAPAVVAVAVPLVGIVVGAVVGAGVYYGVGIGTAKIVGRFRRRSCANISGK